MSRSRPETLRAVRITRPTGVPSRVCGRSFAALRFGTTSDARIGRRVHRRSFSGVRSNWRRPRILRHGLARGQQDGSLTCPDRVGEARAALARPGCSAARPPAIGCREYLKPGGCGADCIAHGTATSEGSRSHGEPNEARGTIGGNAARSIKPGRPTSTGSQHVSNEYVKRLILLLSPTNTCLHSFPSRSSGGGRISAVRHSDPCPIAIV
jgi:hypothetical protein